MKPRNFATKAAALAYYARQRDDTELEVWTSEIKLRACQRIGEISRELEKVETAGPSSVRIPASGKPKAQVLAEAGISTSTANRYEQLTGSSDEQGIAAGLAARTDSRRRLRCTT
jgi:hypothetical protein